MRVLFWTVAAFVRTFRLFRPLRLWLRISLHPRVLRLRWNLSRQEGRWHGTEYWHRYSDDDDMEAA